MVPEVGHEERLIERCKAGDSSSYAELVSGYQDTVFNALYRILGNHDDACDAMQETFMKAWGAMGSFRGECKFGTWLYRIAVNTARSTLRQRRPVTALRGASDDCSADDPVSNEPDASEKASQTEEYQLVSAALGRLDDDQRQVVVLHEILGCDYAEMAEILDCPRGTVKSRLHRARTALRQALAGKIRDE